MSNTWKIILIILALLVLLLIVRAIVVGSVLRAAVKDGSANVNVSGLPQYQQNPNCQKGTVWNGRACVSGAQGN